MPYQDGSTSSRQLLRSLDATEGIRLHRYADLGQAFADLRSGDMVGGIVVPRDFERGLLRGQETVVPFYSEAAHLLSYGMLVQGGRLATENLGAGARVERLRKQGVPESAALALQVRGRIDARLLYNPAGNYASNTVPPVFVLILQQIMIIGCAMLAVTRKERFPHAPAFCLSGPVRACHTCHFRLYADGLPRSDAGRCPAILGPADPAQCRGPGGLEGTASAQG